MVTTGATQPGASEARATGDTDSPVPRLQWACAFPMTGVRYYRFLPDVPGITNDPGHDQEMTEPEHPVTGPQGPGEAVRGAS